MTATPPPSFAKFASIYPASRQRLFQIAQAHGRQILADPARMAAILSKPTPLQSALADPQQRAVMAAKLKTLTA